jgi:hypothetical protein
LGTRASLRPLTFQSYELNVARAVESIGAIRLQQLTPAMLNRLYGELGRERKVDDEDRQAPDRRIRGEPLRRGGQARRCG